MRSWERPDSNNQESASLLLGLRGRGPLCPGRSASLTAGTDGVGWGLAPKPTLQEVESAGQ